MALNLEVVSESHKFDVVVVGAGVSGIMAAMTCAQAGCSTCVIEKQVPGGLFKKAAIVKNYPGNSKTSSISFICSLFQQATQDNSVVYMVSNISNICKKNKYFYLYGQDNQIWQAKCVIIASGGEFELEQDYSCFSNVVYSYANNSLIAHAKNVVILNQDNDLLPGIIDYLYNLATKIIVVPFGEKGLSLQRMDRSKIQYCTAKFQKFITDKDTVTAVGLQNNEQISCHAVFFNLIARSKLDFLPHDLVLDQGKIKVHDSCVTSLAGIYATGLCTTCQNHHFLISTLERSRQAGVKAIQYVNEFQE